MSASALGLLFGQGAEWKIQTENHHKELDRQKFADPKWPYDCWHNRYSENVCQILLAPMPPYFTSR